jgi:RNA recognition motif-containing protein
MENNLFVGGFPWETTEGQLAAIFGACGTVVSVKILLDRETRRSRGLAFIVMGSEDEAVKAMAKLDGSTIGERTIFVSEARPKPGEESAGPAPGSPESKPGFVERRTGKDRRKGWGPVSARPAEGERRFGERKPFGERRPFGDRKPFGEKRSFGDKKPWEKKPWSKDKPSFGEKKPWSKDKPSFGEKKPWSKDKPSFGDKKPWEKKPWSKDKPSFGGKKRGPGGGDRKKWGAGGPGAGGNKWGSGKPKKFG